MAKTIGIDLGTSNSVVACVENGTPMIITNNHGGRITPSVVTYEEDETWTVGNLSKRQRIVKPLRTQASVKRYIGENIDLYLGDKYFSPDEISSKILEYLKDCSKEYFGEDVTDVVITVPAYFSHHQREATKHAGELAGFNVLRIINEPTAAALAYGLNKDVGEKILVYDLGGGTFDVSILEISNGLFEVKATDGNTNLGGDDFDEKIVEYIEKQLPKSIKLDITLSSRLLEAAEIAKIELSSLQTTTIRIPYFTIVNNEPYHIDIELKRDVFESLIAELINETKESIDNALKDAKLKIEEINKVLFVGGSTRIPMVYESVKKWTGKEPYRGINPDEVVALGAAIQASILTGNIDDVVLLDVTPLTLCIETKGGIATKMIERNTTIPVSYTRTFTTAEDGQTSVEINVVQGERQFAKDNISIGKFLLDGIVPAPMGEPLIDVTFDIDSNGIINVSAKDQITNKEKNVTLCASKTIKKEEIDQMLINAEKYKEIDEKAIEKIKIRNEAEKIVHNARKIIKENEELISEELLKDILDGILAIEENYETENPTVLVQAIEEVNKILINIGSFIYNKGD
jgi:molecular chaperone DnaK